MPQQGMRQIGGVVFDSLAFARETGVLEGQLAVAALGRLSDLLADQGGSLSCRLRGGRNEQGRLFLHLEASGELHLTCQRCLQALPWVLRLDSRMLLVPPGGRWPDEELADDSADAIEALAEQSLADLVEEEVLLALPLAPRHEYCALPGGTDKESAAGLASPFAALRRVK